jgi:uncharacterized protein
MSSNGSRLLFVNLAVADLDRSVEFFTKLGFTFNPEFTDETATCMIVSEQAFVMLLTQAKFREFITTDVSDPTTQTEVLMAISATSRDEVDVLADKAIAAGGSHASNPIEMDFMYARSFRDPDGHIWEVTWMDEAAFTAA